MNQEKAETWISAQIGGESDGPGWMSVACRRSDGEIMWYLHNTDLHVLILESAKYATDDGMYIGWLWYREK